MELCPLCKTALQIKNSYLQLEGDDSPDTETKAYMVLERQCVNKNCEKYKTVVDTVRHEQKIGGEGQTE